MFTTLFTTGLYQSTTGAQMRARSQVTLCASTKSNKYMYTDTEKSSGVGTDAKDARRVARDLVCKNKPGKKSLKKNKHGKKSFKKKNEHGNFFLRVFITFGGGTHHTDARRIALDLLRDENLQLLLVHL